MLRTFQTHRIRKTEELSGKLWSFRALEGENRGKERKVPVPSCWETYPGFENYRGRAVYETEFPARGNVRLEFKGVSHNAVVSVDGRRVAQHYNAYTPFDVVLKGLGEGRHILKIEVDNSFQKQYALNRPNDYMSYGGISRGVVLEHIPDCSISGIHFTPLEKANGIWRARVEIHCTNLSKETQKNKLEVVLGGQTHQFDVSVEYGEHKVVDEVIPFQGVSDWSPENPVLYLLEAALRQGEAVIDDLIERVGFRTVQVKENRILLNGGALKIKGFCRHEDHPQFGCALPFEAIAYDLALIRDMGGNSVRTAHYPNDEIFLDLCDELGILVWEENHARGMSEEMMKNPLFEPQAEQVIREMITRHYNHPSIYIWGILNECASQTEFGRDCYQKQYQLIRELDRSRPCSSATCRYADDRCLDLPDVVSWNIYPYWYEDKTAVQMLDEVYRYTQSHGGAGKPFLITEIGAGAIYGFRSSDHDKWTEEYQAETVTKQLAEVMAYEQCMGLYIWQFCDNRVNREYFGKRPRTRNNKGIVDEFRRRKLAYEAVKELFGEKENERNAL